VPVVGHLVLVLVEQTLHLPHSTQRSATAQRAARSSAAAAVWGQRRCGASAVRVRRRGDVLLHCKLSRTTEECFSCTHYATLYITPSEVRRCAKRHGAMMHRSATHTAPALQRNRCDVNRRLQ
jgi:hypothetical protein